MGSVRQSVCPGGPGSQWSGKRDGFVGCLCPEGFPVLPPVAFVENVSVPPRQAPGGTASDVNFVSCVTPIRLSLMSSSIMNAIWGFASCPPPRVLSRYLAVIAVRIAL